MTSSSNQTVPQEKHHLQPNGSVKQADNGSDQRANGKPDGYQMDGTGSLRDDESYHKQKPDGSSPIHIVTSFRLGVYIS